MALYQLGSGNQFLLPERVVPKFRYPYQNMPGMNKGKPSVPKVVRLGKSGKAALF